jgi:hypothetical protein
MTDALHIVCHKPLFMARSTALDPVALATTTLSPAALPW